MKTDTHELEGIVSIPENYEGGFSFNCSCGELGTHWSTAENARADHEDHVWNARHETEEED